MTVYAPEAVPGMLIDKARLCLGPSVAKHELAGLHSEGASPQLLEMQSTACSAIRQCAE